MAGDTEVSTVITPHLRLYIGSQSSGEKRHEAQQTGGNLSVFVPILLMPFLIGNKDHTLKTKQPHTNKEVINTYKTTLDPEDRI